MARLRFCMLTTFYPPWSFGGDAIQVQRLVHALAERGHEVTVVHSREGYRTMAGAEPDRPADGHPGVRVVGIDAGLGPISPIATHLTGRPLLARRRIAKALEGPFDVLHFHNPSLLGGPGILGMGRGVKLYTLHEQWLVCPTHVLWRYQREVCPEPHCVRCQLTYRRPPQLWRHTDLLERSVAGLDALIAPSRTSASLHERFAGKVRIERIPHFVPEPEPGAPYSHGRPYFLYAGRLEPIKGVSKLIQAFRRHPQQDLLIVGDGTLREALEREARELPNVQLLGWRSRTGLSALYRGALAAIVPTLGHEAFGLVAAEAFAHGTPAVVPRFGALDELVSDSGGGLSYGTDDELDAALSELAGDPERRSALGARAREAFLAQWTVDRHLDRYLALVAAVAEQRGDRRLADRAAAARSAEPLPS
jgi:glycosyltransferase involved in cell wall biosynthesis